MSQPDDRTSKPDAVPELTLKDGAMALSLLPALDASVACITDCENCIIAGGAKRS